MSDSPFPNSPIDIAILIKDAQAARITAHIPVIVSQLKSHVNLSSNREANEMHKGLFDDCEGPIRGLRLPLNAWVVLERENITTLPQLTAIADRIERFPGIEATTALAIRVELSRVDLLEARSSGSFPSL